MRLCSIRMHRLHTAAVLGAEAVCFGLSVSVMAQGQGGCIQCVHATSGGLHCAAQCASFDTAYLAELPRGWGAAHAHAMAHALRHAACAAAAQCVCVWAATAVTVCPKRAGTAVGEPFYILAV